jgi:hypothetical protein
MICKNVANFMPYIVNFLQFSKIIQLYLNKVLFSVKN